MVWAIDIGNTAIKLGIFRGDALLEVKRFERIESIVEIAKMQKPEGTIVCNVGRMHDHEQKLLAETFERLVFLTYKSVIPFLHAYETPHTLGMDRIAAVAGALLLYPNQASLVVDMGTCMTLDFVDNGPFYHGGRIVPGRQMRFKAMHTFTESLPLVDDESGSPRWGNSTKACMASGVDWGIVAEVEGAIKEFQEKFEFFNVILCGGDAEYFESKIKATIFAIQHLTLYGLKSIFELNVR